MLATIQLQMLNIKIRIKETLYFNSYFAWTGNLSHRRILGRQFKPKRGEVIGGWRKLHWPSKELHNFYSVLNIVLVTKPRMGGPAARMGDKIA
jgi:hypothetical protein